MGMSAQPVTMAVAVVMPMSMIVSVPCRTVCVVVHCPILTGVNQLQQHRFSNASEHSQPKSSAFPQSPRHHTATNLPAETQLTPHSAPPTMTAVLLKLPLGGVHAGGVPFAQP
jgi:hypothetical protein